MQGGGMQGQGQGQQFGGPPGGGMQGGPRGRGGGLLGGLFGGNKGRGQQQQFGGGMQGGQRQQQFGQQGQQFGQQGGYMGYQRSAPEIFRQEAPRQLQDAMVFLQPAAVMTAAAILGVAVFSDVGGSGGVDNARYKAASKVTLALDLTLALHFLPPRPPSPTFARTLTTDGSIPGASTPLHLPPLHPFTLHHPSTPSASTTPPPLHPSTLYHPPSHPSTLYTPHSTLHTLPFRASRFPRRARPTASRCPRRKTTLGCRVIRRRAGRPSRGLALRRAP